MSEFGKGFTYCIGLFLAHTERGKNRVAYDGLCFDAAADHLGKLEIPENFNLKKECLEWRDKCLNWRLEKYTDEDRIWALEQAKKFLLEWDKQNGIKVEKGDWE